MSMRPLSVFAKGPGSEIEQLRAELQDRWRQVVRAVMALLSLRGLAASQIAELLDCHPATVRRWIGGHQLTSGPQVFTPGFRGPSSSSFYENYDEFKPLAYVDQRIFNAIEAGAKADPRPTES